LYQRVPRLGEELRIRHGNGTFGKWLIALAKTDVLLLDDWGMAGIDSQTRADLMEIIDDRAASKATNTICAAQLLHAAQPVTIDRNQWSRSPEYAI
jgi:DNA replication protein DnaC